MLKQMGKACFALGLMLGPHIIPDGYGDDRGLAVRMHYHPQAIGKRELLVRNIYLADQVRNRGSGLWRLGKARHSQGNGHQSNSQHPHGTYLRHLTNFLANVVLL